MLDDGTGDGKIGGSQLKTEGDKICSCRASDASADVLVRCNHGSGMLRAGEKGREVGADNRKSIMYRD